MLKISSRLSVRLSLAVSVLFFVLCAAGAFAIPRFCRLLVDMHDDYLTNISKTFIISDSVLRAALAIGLSYCALSICVIANCLLFRLLRLVEKGNVFTVRSVALIRGVSWCCFFLGFVFCAFSLLFTVFLVLSFVAFFLGMCLRVVKNAIEEATNIKNENDLTV